MKRKSDSEIRLEVLRELEWDSRLGWVKLGVDVFDGVVTLTGIVTSYPQKLAAQAAAYRVEGALDVANDIQIVPTGFNRTDADVERAIRHVLEWDALVPAESIQSTVANGWVTITGDVEFLHEREEAERAVLRLEGVVGVINEIRVRPGRVNPEELRGQIENALEQSADREAELLRIELHDGAVDLFGRVHSWQEKQAVLGSIGHAPGVSAVRDHLRVDPYF